MSWALISSSELRHFASTLAVVSFRQFSDFIHTFISFSFPVSSALRREIYVKIMPSVNIQTKLFCICRIFIIRPNFLLKSMFRNSGNKVSHFSQIISHIFCGNRSFRSTTVRQFNSTQIFTTQIRGWWVHCPGNGGTYWYLRDTKHTQI